MKENVSGCFFLNTVYIRYLLTYLLTYFDMYDHLGYTKTA